MFEKTIESLNKIHNFSQEIKELISTDGISAPFANVQSTAGLNTLTLPNGKVLQCFGHIKVVSYKDFQAFGAPKLHFCACDEFLALIDSKNPLLSLVQAQKNSFSFTVQQGNVTTAWYADYPLPFCESCVEILRTLLAKSGNNENQHLTQKELEKIVFSKNFIKFFS